VKNKKKPRGIKHKIREEKKREQRIGLAVTGAILIIIVSVSCFLINSMLNQPSTNQTTTSSASQPKSAIVDHLSLTAPNQTFIQTATNTLKQAGYTVDYYPGEKVTVGFYGNLQKKGYSLIILRVHSSSHRSSEGQAYITPAVFFTSELYSKTRYVSEQLADKVLRVSYGTSDSKEYFAIGPKFVITEMKGEFKDATIIMMGCEGLISTHMAQAFTSKGAKAYIGWNGGVSASHTDQATAQLLQHLTIEKQTIKQAVDTTMKEVGADPIHKSLLTYYPLEVGDQKTEDVKSNL
jgi:hypothetical protein